MTSPAADEFSPGAVDSFGQYAQGGAQWVLAFYGVLEHFSPSRIVAGKMWEEVLKVG